MRLPVVRRHPSSPASVAALVATSAAAASAAPMSTATLAVRSFRSVRTQQHVARRPTVARSSRANFSSSSSSSSSSTLAASAVEALPAHITPTACGLFVDRSLPSNFTKILIANRGEIACRVIRTCKEIGVKTVAIYSDADVDSLHVQMADEAYRIGGPPAAQSYLLGAKIIEIAKLSGAQAIHPGYGFLSENAGFARLCEQEGVVFIGPPVGAIEAMGSKSASKIIMTKANVPVVPGYHGEDQSIERLEQEAMRVGFPLMIKAVLGGGGKGMRIVRSKEEFLENLEASKREARNSFSDDRVLLERYIIRPRHIEFQVFADKHGNVVHLCERDCSVQRRHQKVLEEAPAPGMTPELRHEMGMAAVNAARAVGYVGAGTVEFIFDAETDEYYFMEMNTRLQVEHPVTEMIVRRDLVQWQLHVAYGHALPAKQDDLRAHGYAIEARIYAENPDNNFLPATGKLLHLKPPKASPHVRIESHLRTGDAVSIFYDPMIAKLITWAPSRELALERMSTALDAYEIVGVVTNVEFVKRSVRHPVFRRGRVETGFIAQNIADLLPKSSKVPMQIPVATAVLSLLLREAAHLKRVAAGSSDAASPWHSASSFRINAPRERAVRLLRCGFDAEGQPVRDPIDVHVTHVSSGAGAGAGAGGAAGGSSSGAQSVAVTMKMPDGSSVAVTGELSTTAGEESVLYARIGTQAFRASVVHTASTDSAHRMTALEYAPPALVNVFVCGENVQFQVPEVNFDAAGAGGAGGSGAAGCMSPMAGKVVKVNVAAGDKVKRGAPLVIMEAMKMEHVIRAPADGIVKSVAFAPGDFVEGGKVLVTFQA